MFDINHLSFIYVLLLVNDNLPTVTCSGRLQMIMPYLLLIKAALGH